MREIIFRGKTENGEWVYGFYLGIVEFPNSIAKNCIVECKLDYDYVLRTNAQKVYTVIPETVGQFTGLTDKNGKKIFEGDILRIKYEETTIEKAVVEYAGFGFYGATIGDYWELENYYEIEVIGNWWDNPELLENV